MNLQLFDHLFEVTVNGVSYVCSEYSLSPAFGDDNSMMKISSESAISPFSVGTPCMNAHKEDAETCKNCKKEFDVYSYIGSEERNYLRDPFSQLKDAKKISYFNVHKYRPYTYGGTGCHTIYGAIISELYKIDHRRSFDIITDSSNIHIEKLQPDRLNHYKKWDDSLVAEINETTKQSAIDVISKGLGEWMKKYKEVFFHEEIPAVIEPDPVPDVIEEVSRDSLWARIYKALFK